MLVGYRKEKKYNAGKKVGRSDYLGFVFVGGAVIFMSIFFSCLSLKRELEINLSSHNNSLFHLPIFTQTHFHFPVVFLQIFVGVVTNFCRLYLINGITLLLLLR